MTTCTMKNMLLYPRIEVPRFNILFFKAGGYKLPFFSVGGLYFVLCIPVFIVLIGYSGKCHNNYVLKSNHHHITGINNFRQEYKAVIASKGNLWPLEEFRYLLTGYDLL